MNIKVWDSTEKVYAENIETIDEAFAVIAKYLEDLHFKSYYYRQNLLDDKAVQIDYGSHTHFFYMQDQDGEHIFPVEQVFSKDEFDFDEGPNSLEELFEKDQKSYSLKEVKLQLFELENLKIAIEDLEDIQNEVSDLNHIPINKVKKETQKIVNKLEKVMDDLEKLVQ